MGHFKQRRRLHLKHFYTNFLQLKCKWCKKKIDFGLKCPSCISFNLLKNYLLKKCRKVLVVLALLCAKQTLIHSEMCNFKRFLCLFLLLFNLEPDLPFSKKTIEVLKITESAKANIDSNIFEKERNCHKKFFFEWFVADRDRTCHTNFWSRNKIPETKVSPIFSPFVVKRGWEYERGMDRKNKGSFKRLKKSSTTFIRFLLLLCRFTQIKKFVV